MGEIEEGDWERPTGEGGLKKTGGGGLGERPSGGDWERPTERDRERPGEIDGRTRGREMRVCVEGGEALCPPTPRVCGGCAWRVGWGGTLDPPPQPYVCSAGG